ncbi:MAG: nucleotidyl transferase AbiEii/AbiGii toxin family protein [Microgenomates group bacterium]|nr:nucleotidyl transferase AbiEii/AbiGii toxin family protein [Microgenomates group bacterium]
MINKDQIFSLVKKHKINETAILREYIQLYFLSRFYDFEKSQKIFFKGGTAIHFLFNSPRFSEDLDFTIEMNEGNFDKFINSFFKLLEKEEFVSFKERKTIVGKKYLLTYENLKVASFPVFINLDFSFREKIFYKTKSIIKTDFPVIFRSYVYHPEKKELLAEKIRAFLTRTVGRDLYDLWFLLNQNIEIDEKLVLEKLRYYDIEKFNFDMIKQKLKKLNKNDFVKDLKPFVTFSEREKLNNFFDYLIDFINKY